MKKKEVEVWKKYHIPGSPAYVRRPKDCIYISTANSLIHEIAKTIIAYEIKKQGRHFITEAVPNDRQNRRIDVVDLEGTEIEIETNLQVFKIGSKTYYVIKKEKGWEIREKD